MTTLPSLGGGKFFAEGIGFVEGNEILVVFELYCGNSGRPDRRGRGHVHRELSDRNLDRSVGRGGSRRVASIAAAGRLTAGQAPPVLRGLIGALGSFAMDYGPTRLCSERGFVLAAPTTVDEYMAALTDERRSGIETLRQAINAAAPDATETIAYGMPALRSHGGQFLVSVRRTRTTTASSRRARRSSRRAAMS